ncbi:MAG: hypothetical protein HOJ22_04550, partial [Chloroflexi bacterium]|nr:hypothetical protein [Chloroflexota bacterium]
MIISLIAFITISSQSLTVARAESDLALSVMSQKVEIDYGEKIAITAIVDAGIDADQIQAVRTLFRARGGSTIWSYSYPQFSPSSTGTNVLEVSFEILTGPGSYYPPGAEFDIEIEITDSTGETASVISPEPIEYLDPAYDWERVKGNGYTIVYYGVARSSVDDLIEKIDHRIPTLEATLGVTDPPNFKAIVFPNIQDATPSFPPVSKTATDQFLFAGFAQPEYRLFVQGQMNSTTFTHELAHLYTHEAVSSSFLGGIPSWLNEGLSRFLESGSSEQSNNRLRDSVRPDELLSLNHMQTIPGQRSDVFIFYPQAGAFVGYLVEEYSHATMADFLDQLNKGRAVEDAFEIIFDKPLYEAENDWRALFGADALPIPVATVEPVESSVDQADNTRVPLIDYEAAADAASGNSSSQPQATTTTAPSSLPTVTPENTPVFDPSIFEEKQNPNWAVAGIVIGLSVIVGVWLFTSR